MIDLDYQLAEGDHDLMWSAVNRELRAALKDGRLDPVKFFDFIMQHAGVTSVDLIAEYYDVLHDNDEDMPSNDDWHRAYAQEPTESHPLRIGARVILAVDGLRGKFAGHVGIVDSYTSYRHIYNIRVPGCVVPGEDEEYVGPYNREQFEVIDE